MTKKLTLEFCKQGAIKRNYEIRDEIYINAREKMEFFHLDCKTSSFFSWGNFYAGHGCRKCASRKFGDSIMLKLDDCKQYALSEGYEINESNYYGNDINMIFIHIANDCNHTYPTSWSNFYSGKRCPKCAGNIRLTIEFCKQESEKRGFILLSNSYSNNSKVMNFYHPECDNEFSISWECFRTLKGCKVCAMKMQQSPQATQLKDYYEEFFNGRSEYKILKNPITGYWLPYDIFIPKQYENSDDVFIEIHGHQHYRFDNFYHKTLEEFEYRQHKDKLKRKYAKKHGIFIEIDLRKKESVDSIVTRINDIIYNGYGN